MKECWLILIVLCQSMAQTATADARSEFYEEYYAKNFKGWKGIVFVCTYNASDAVLDKICNRAATDLELLAASHNIKVQIAKPNDHANAIWKAITKHFITLEYELTATEPTSVYAAKAVHARLTYTMFYSNAIEEGARPNSIKSKPRSGDLEVWESSVIGSGTPSDMITSFSNTVESVLKQALTLFLKYRN